MTRLALAQVRLRYVVEGHALDATTEAALKADQRAGAKSILEAVARRRFENRSEGQRLRQLLRYETALWASGVLSVAGVDEAGMARLRPGRGRRRRICAGIADPGGETIPRSSTRLSVIGSPSKSRRRR